MKIWLLIFELFYFPLMIIGGIVLGAKSVKPGDCEYVAEERSYLCKNIVDKFPNKFYGNYALRCTDCVFTTFGKEVFPHNNDLMAMNLSSSSIHTIAKDAFQSLSALQYIHLEHNHLKTISEGAFYGLRQLFELHLEHNELKDLNHGFTNGLEANSLFMSYNLIEEVPNDIFEGIFGIMTLDLSNNGLHMLHLDSFAHLKGLEYLDLHNNKLCRLPLGVFRHLRLLKDLNLSNNNFKKFAIGTFAGMPNLYALNLSHTAISDVNPSVLTSLEGLALLDVSATNIEYIDAMEIFASSPQLKHIGLAENRWNCRVLGNIMHYLRQRQIRVIEHNHYEVINIKGIACTDNPITNEPIPFDIFYKLVKQESDRENANVC